MHRIAFALVAACALAGTASAHYRILEKIEDSYELALDSVTLPGSTAGSIIFTPCSGCNVQSLRVSAATRYFVNGTELAFADFEREADAIRAALDERDAGVGVFYDIETRYVKRIRIVQAPQ